VETFEALLNQIPDDVSIEDPERIELFMWSLKAAWQFLLHHEFSHIIEGHLRFKLDNAEVVRNNRAYVRAMEMQADNCTFFWMRQQAGLNFPLWMGPVLLPNGFESSAKFYAIVVSNLFLVTRLQELEADLSDPVYIPHEIRQNMAVGGLLKALPWDDDEELQSAWVSALTEATKDMKRISGWDSDLTPTLVFDVAIEQHLAWFEKVYGELEELHPNWQYAKL
jgi:hypothetical protein